MTATEFADYVLGENEAKSKEILRNYYLEKEPAVKLIPSFDEIYGNKKSEFIQQTRDNKYTQISTTKISFTNRLEKKNIHDETLLLRGNIECKRKLRDHSTSTFTAVGAGMKPKNIKTQHSTKTGFDKNSQKQRSRKKRDFFGQKTKTERLENGTTAERLEIGTTTEHRSIEIKVENTVSSNDEKSSFQYNRNDACNRPPSQSFVPESSSLDCQYQDRRQAPSLSIVENTVYSTDNSSTENVFPDCQKRDNNRGPSLFVVPETKSYSVLDELIGFSPAKISSSCTKTKRDNSITVSPKYHVEPESVFSDSNNSLKRMNSGNSVLDDLMLIGNVKSEINPSREKSRNRESTVNPYFVKSVLDDLLLKQNVKSETNSPNKESENRDTVTGTETPYSVKSVLNDKLSSDVKSETNLPSKKESRNHDGTTSAKRFNPLKSVLDDLLDFGESPRKQRKRDSSMTSSSDDEHLTQHTISKCTVSKKPKKKMVKGSSILDELIG